MGVVPLVKGIATFVPGVSRFMRRRSGATDSARYCYSIWLRHLVMAHRSGLSTQSGVVAELGPGASLGVGLAALLSGAKRYIALDVQEYASDQRNLEVLDGLGELFARRERIPDQAEFPNAEPLLDSYEFPSHILTGPRLTEALDEARVASIRGSLSGVGAGGHRDSPVVYVSPWYDPDVIEYSSVDMVVSQAVLEHVNDLGGAYGAMRNWLKPGGVMSHTIDFKSHGTAGEWNGHWAYSDLAWRLIVGKRPYLLNRQPHSAHMELLDRFDFRVTCDVKSRSDGGIAREDLAPRFRHLSDDDLTTIGAFMQAVCVKA